MPRNFSPHTVQQDQTLISRVQGAGQPYSFGEGVFWDLPVTPPNALKYVDNYIVWPDRLESRAGSRKWSTTGLPALLGRTGYTTTSTVSGTVRTVVKTVGTDFTATDVGNYYVNDSGVHERIETYSSASTITTYTDDETSGSDSSGWVRGPVNALYHHASEDKIVMLLGSDVYIADDLLISAWTKSFCVSYDTPTDAISKFDEYEQYAFLFNSAGVFKIDISATSDVEYYRINTPVPTSLIDDSSLLSNGKPHPLTPYGRRYVYSMSRLTGDGLRDRNTSGVQVVHETGTTKVNDDFRDYGARYKLRPFGDGSTSYGVLTGGALSDPYDTSAGWASVTNGQFTISIGGSSANIKCDFTSVLSMAEVAERIQLGLRDSFSRATCEFSNETNDHFIITDPDDGGATTVTTAGSSGTDIGTSIMACESGTGTVTTPAYSDPENVRALLIPVDDSDGTPQYQDTHYSIYSTVDIGANGVDPLSGEGNNPELFVWNGDVVVAQSFTAEVDANDIIILDGGQLFSQKDVDTSLNFLDLTSVLLLYLCDAAGNQVYTSTSRYAQGSTVGVVSSQSAAFGWGVIATGAITVTGSETVGGSTFTKTAGTRDFASTDERKVLFLADGTWRHIARFVDADTVELVGTNTAGSQAATFSPTQRHYNDIVTDYDLKARIAGYALKQRFWTALPQSNLGEIASGFMFVSQTSGDKVSYSQMPIYSEYLAGYYNEAYQYATIKGSIQELVEFPDSVIVFCAGSTHEIPTNVFDEAAVEEVGEVVSILSGQVVRDAHVGALHGSIAKMDKGTAMVITTEPGLRLFDGQQYSDNLAENRFMKKIRKLQAAYTTVYDQINGFVWWGLDETA